MPTLLDLLTATPAEPTRAWPARLYRWLAIVAATVLVYCLYAAFLLLLWDLVALELHGPLLPYRAALALVTGLNFLARMVKNTVAS